MITLLDDKVTMVSSLKEKGIMNFVPSHCFEEIDAAIEFCGSGDNDSHRYVLKAATSCDSLDVTFGTKAELKEHLVSCKNGEAGGKGASSDKALLYSRCVIQPDIWSSSIRVKHDLPKHKKLKSGEKLTTAETDNDSLCEWRIYIVYCNNKYRVVDKCRLCWSAKRERWGDFIKTPISIVKTPDGMEEITLQICEAFKSHMSNGTPMMMGIDYVTDKDTGEHKILEINVDDAASAAHCGADVGVRSLKRVTRGMSVDEKKYIDRDCMIASFSPV